MEYLPVWDKICYAYLLFFIRIGFVISIWFCANVAIVPPPLVALIEYCLNQMHASDVRIDSKGTA